MTCTCRENMNMQKNCDNVVELSMLRERSLGILEGCTLKLNKPHTYKLTFYGETINLNKGYQKIC